uniref:Very-long-chain 3-oxoacyl-CoA synthase n=1 Tax=Meloidogyne floridensis TaxID=298350 RepID=A0A915NNG9_9BILA
MTSKLINYNNNISLNSSKICLSQHNLRLSAHFVEKIFIGILLPPIILFGLIGNCLNLLILLGGSKRKIARIILGVCFERFIAISNPLSIHKSRPFGIKLFLVIVIIATFLLTFYVHLRWKTINSFLANSQLIYLYLHYSPIIHAVFVVFLPTVLIIFSNLGLLFALYKRNYLSGFIGHSDSLKTTKSLDLSRKSICLNTFRVEYRLLFALYKRNYLSGFIGHSDSLKTTKSLDLNRKSICLNTFRVEYRVTFIVTPSAIIQLFVGPVSAKDPYVTLRALTVFLVTLGKSLNFVIFCLNSASFRSRLINFVNSKINQKRLSLTSRRTYTQITELQTNQISGFWIFIWVLSKIPELFDTLFLILKGRPIRFMHWFHHSMSILFGTINFIGDNAYLVWVVWMNFFIHSIMYREADDAEQLDDNEDEKEIDDSEKEEADKKEGGHHPKKHGGNHNEFRVNQHVGESSNTTLIDTKIKQNGEMMEKDLLRVKRDAYGEVANGEVSYGKDAYGGKAYGGKAYGGKAYGGKAYGGRAYGGMAYGGKAYGEDTYGDDAYGEDAYGEDAYKEDAYEADAYERNAYGGTAYGRNAYGKDAYGEDAYGGDAYGGDAYGGDAYGGNAYGGKREENLKNCWVQEIEMKD